MSGRAQAVLRRSVALFQIGGGLLGAVTTAMGLQPRVARPHFFAGVIESAFAASLVAGVMLWRGSDAGVRLSRIIQAAQLLRVSTRSIEYSFYTGVWLGPMIQWPNVGLSLEFGGEFAVRVAHVAVPPTNGVSIGVNLIAIVALATLRTVGTRPERLIDAVPIAPSR